MAKLPRESLVSETGSNTNVSADEIEYRSQTGMRYREDNRDRSAPCSTDAEVVAPTALSIARQQMTSSLLGSVPLLGAVKPTAFVSTGSTDMNCPTNVEWSQQTETLMATLLTQADCLSVSRRGATALTDRVHATLNVKGVGTVSWTGASV